MTEPRTGRFGHYFGIIDGEENEASLRKRSHDSIMGRISKMTNDGRNYIIWVSTARADNGNVGEMFTDDVTRYKATARVALGDYKQAEVGEFTVLPDDNVCTEKDTFFVMPKEDEKDDTGWPIEAVKIGDLCFEYCGWAASPNQVSGVYIRVPSDKHDIASRINNAEAE
jgi:hypothetical protein